MRRRDRFVSDCLHHHPFSRFRQVSFFPRDERNFRALDEMGRAYGRPGGPKATRKGASFDHFLRRRRCIFRQAASALTETGLHPTET
jgi:hypothetical protein